MAGRPLGRQVGAGARADLGDASAQAAPVAGVNAQDQTFLRGAHQSNLAEIASAQLAQQKATTQTVKDLAARWLTDHTKLDNDLKPVAQRLQVTLPAAPNAQQQATARRYQQLSGAAFDKFWVESQMTGHMAAMQLGDAEAANGQNADVKQLAAASAPVIAEHGRLLDQAAPEVGAQPHGVDAGNGVSESAAGRWLPAGALLGSGVLAAAGSVLYVRRRQLDPAGQ